MRAFSRQLGAGASLLVLMTCALGLPWAAAQQSLRGQLLSPDGKNWPHEVRFMIISSDGSFQQYFFTDSKGGFVVPGLRRGRRYTLIVDGDGDNYETTRVEVNLDQIQYLPVFLNPPVSKTKRPVSGTLDSKIKSVPPEAQRYYDEAISKVRNSKLKDSIRLFEKAIQSAPEYYEAINDLGVVHLKLQNLPEAEKMLKRAAELRPGEFRPLVNLGIIYSRQNRHEEAVSTLTRCLQIQSGIPEAERYLGESLLELGRLDEAEQHLSRALGAKDENRPYAMIKLAIVKIQKNDNAAGILFLEQYLADYPKADNRADIEKILKQLR